MKTTFILASLFMAATATKWGVTEVKDLDLESAKKERASDPHLNYIHCYLDIVPGEIPPTPRGAGPNFKPLRLIDQNPPGIASKTQPETSETPKSVVIEDPKEKTEIQTIPVVTISNPIVEVRDTQEKPEIQTTPVVTLSKPISEAHDTQPLNMDSGVNTNIVLDSDLSKPEVQLQAEPVIGTTIGAQPNLDEASKLQTDLGQHLIEDQLKKQIVEEAIVRDPTDIRQEENLATVVKERQENLDGDTFRLRARRILANTAPYSWAVKCMDSNGVGKPVTIKICKKDSLELIYTDKYGNKNNSWSKSITLPLEKGTTRYQNDILWPFFTDSGVTDNSITYTDCSVTFKKSSILGVIAFLIAAFVL